ncbi:MAG: SLC26A/SulP transporter family protein [Alphaproteobacteria bacterium]|nr:SLC26A/SulP transporter family protein [Alphaproteobacteria bacterium]
MKGLRSLSGDLWGGLASMLVALPAAIAFGVLVFSAIDPALASTGAVAGALGAAVLGLVSPVVGGNGGMVTGPCAPAAAVTASLAGALAAAGHPVERILPLLALMAVLSGVLQASYGLLGLGRLMKYIPYQVVSGFLSGVAVIIAVGQLPKLLGLPAGTGLIGVVQPGLWAWQGVVVGGATIAAVVLAPKVTERVPAAVIGLAVGVAAYFALALGWPELRTIEGNRLVIGSLGGGPPLTYMSGRLASLGTLRPTDVALVIAAAGTLSALSTIDTLKTAVVLDVLTRTRHDSNRELVGQGVANVASALLGGIPGGGTMGPTLVNVTSGGRTPLSGFLEGVFALVAIALLTPLLAWIPIGALAGLLLVVAAKMFDWKSLRLVTRANTRLDFVVIAIVVGVALYVGLIEASVAGTCLAILLYIRDQASTSVIRSRRDLRRAASKTRRSEAARDVLDVHGDEGLVVALQGSLFFGTTDQLFSELAPDLAKCRYIDLDLRRVQSMDYTAGRMLQQMQSQLAERGGSLMFSGMPGAATGVAEYLAELGLVGEGGIPVFASQNDALEAMEDGVLEAQGTLAEPVDAPPMPIEAMRLFRGLDDDAMAALRAAVRVLEVDEGAVVFARKDHGRTLFLVAKGAVDIVLPLKQGARHHLATITRDDHFGEIGFLEGRSRTADAVARRPSVLYALDRERFDAAAARFPRIGQVVFFGLATEVSRRLRQADKELRALEDR